MLDEETALNLSQELKIDLFTIHREYLQLLFLKYLYSQIESRKIYFKGGTALRFLYDSFRFSEDLDFTSLISEKKIISLIQKALRTLNKETTGVDFKKMDFYNKKTTPETLTTVVKNFPQDEIKTDLTRFLPLSHRNLVREVKKLTLNKLENLT